MQNINFKTSHVIVYLRMRCRNAELYANFKTSHVIVYLECHWNIQLPFPISKHLMLLFIIYATDNVIDNIHFKTSHVIVYQRLRKYNRLICLISKHLMLLFIYSPTFIVTSWYTFQNISCYCLSMNKLNGLESGLWFQNISCYCLSCSTLENLHKFWKFQNISCYCLSTSHSHTLSGNSISKHLMLLFI